MFESSHGGLFNRCQHRQVGDLSLAEAAIEFERLRFPVRWIITAPRMVLICASSAKTHTSPPCSGFDPSLKRRRSRIGRNDPFPCGSGKKYKHLAVAPRQSGRAVRKPPLTFKHSRRLFDPLEQFARLLQQFADALTFGKRLPRIEGVLQRILIALRRAGSSRTPMHPAASFS